MKERHSENLCRPFDGFFWIYHVHRENIKTFFPLYWKVINFELSARLINYFASYGKRCNNNDGNISDGLAQTAIQNGRFVKYPREVSSRNNNCCIMRHETVDIILLYKQKHFMNVNWNEALLKYERGTQTPVAIWHWRHLAVLLIKDDVAVETERHRCHLPTTQRI
jgi:hypothetical protein